MSALPLLLALAVQAPEPPATTDAPPAAPASPAATDIAAPPTTPTPPPTTSVDTPPALPTPPPPPPPAPTSVDTPPAVPTPPAAAPPVREPWRLNPPDRWFALRASAELGFVGVVKHNLQFGKDGTYVDMRKDAGQDVLFP